jgi:hypothetical protein
MSEITGIVGGQGSSALTTTGKLDAYAIFELNFKALGGKEKVKKNDSFYFKGEVTVGSDVFNYEEWSEKPTQSRKKYSNYSKTVYQTGDDGETLWMVNNGKLQTLPDKDSPERLIREGYEDYDYTEKGNRYFRLTSAKVSRIDGDKCYEITIKNTKTDEVKKQYYDAKTFLLKREIKENDGTTSQTDYDDYKSVNGVKIAHKKTIKISDNENTETYRFSEVKRGLYISKTKFAVPETEASKASSTSSSSSSSSDSKVGVNIDTYA